MDKEAIDVEIELAASTEIYGGRLDILESLPSTGKIQQS